MAISLPPSSPPSLSPSLSVVPDVHMEEDDYHVVALVMRELRAFISCLDKIK